MMVKRQHMYGTALAIVMFCMPVATFAATKTWDSGGSGSNCSTGANWSGDTAPDAGDDIIINAAGKDIVWDATCPSIVNSLTINSTFTGSLTVNTRYSGTGFTLFTVTDDLTVNGGTLTHIQNTTAQTYRLRLAVGGDLTVGSSGAISANGKGFYIGPNSGPVPAAYGTGGVNVRWYATGGGYGGQGGRDLWNNAYGKTYGSITAPVDLGSTGTVNLGGPSAGGGAIMLTVTGATTVNGTISADGYGLPFSSDWGNAVGGGSGGSSYITTGSFSGNGTVSVNGGYTYGCCAGGGGGGGRIAIILTDSSSFGDVTLQAAGGGFRDYWDYAAGNDGGSPGTIYLQMSDQTSTTGQLVISANYLYFNDDIGSGVVSSSPIPLSGLTEYPVRSYTSLSDTQRVSYSFSSITVGHEAQLKIASDDALTIAAGGSLSVLDSGSLVTNIDLDLNGISFINTGFLQGTGRILRQSSFVVSPSAVNIHSPVTFTVTDSNQNLNGTVRETVTVSGSEVFTLTETTPSSGIFVGIITTMRGVDVDGSHIFESESHCQITPSFVYTDPDDDTDTNTSGFTLTDDAYCTSTSSGDTGSSGGGGRRSGSTTIRAPVATPSAAVTPLKSAASVSPRVAILRDRADQLQKKITVTKSPLKQRSLQRAVDRLNKIIKRMR